MKATMRIAKLLLSITTVCALVIASAISLGGANPPQTATQAVPIDGDDLGGVVKSAKGPEAGVWVIAETTGLRTKFAKVAVTDDQGRYVVPDLPKVNYNVWVRGYGLVDSDKVSATPGKALNLTAVVAPNPAAAAEYYRAGCAGEAELACRGGQAGRVLSRRLLVLAAESARQE
jgi:hypothetical protein